MQYGPQPIGGNAPQPQPKAPVGIASAPTVMRSAAPEKKVPEVGLGSLCRSLFKKILRKK